MTGVLCFQFTLKFVKNTNQFQFISQFQINLKWNLLKHDSPNFSQQNRFSFGYINSRSYPRRVIRTSHFNIESCLPQKKNIQFMFLHFRKVVKFDLFWKHFLSYRCHCLIVFNNKKTFRQFHYFQLFFFFCNSVKNNRENLEFSQNIFSSF